MTDTLARWEVLCQSEVVFLADNVGDYLKNVSRFWCWSADNNSLTIEIKTYLKKRLTLRKSIWKINDLCLPSEKII